MSVPSFDDLGADGSEFFTRQFPSNGFVKLQTKKDLSNAIRIKSTVQRKLEKDHQEVWFKNRPTLRGKIYGLNVTATGKIASSNQIGDRSVSVGITPESTPDLEFELGSEVETVNEDEVETKYAQVSYTNEQFYGSLKVENDEEGTSLNLSGVVQYPENVFWGLDARIKKEEDRTLELGWNAKIQFRLPNHSTTVHFDNKESKLRLNYLQTISESIKFGTYLNINKHLISPEFGVGYEGQVDPVTTSKAKIEIFEKSTNNKEIRLGLSLTRNLNQYHNTQITIGADINARSFLGTPGGDQHSFGFEIKLR